MSDGTTVTEDTDGEATVAPADVTEATTDTTTTKASTIVDGEASSKDGIGPSGWNAAIASLVDGASANLRI